MAYALLPSGPPIVSSHFFPEIVLSGHFVTQQERQLKHDLLGAQVSHCSITAWGPIKALPRLRHHHDVFCHWDDFTGSLGTLSRLTATWLEEGGLRGTAHA